MLVLSRAMNERIMIGKDIVVTVVAVFGDKVRIGIEAPLYVMVDREEVRLRRGQDRKEAQA